MQQVMTSQIRSHTEYLIHTYNIPVLILYSKLMRNVATLAVFNYELMVILNSGLLFGPPCTRDVFVGVTQGLTTELSWN